MKVTASDPSDAFPELLKRLPPDIDLDALARESKAIQHKRKLTSGANLLRMAWSAAPADCRCVEPPAGRRCGGSPRSPIPVLVTG